MSYNLNAIPLEPTSVKIPTTLVKWDRACDYIPGISSLTNLVDIVEKCFLALTAPIKVNKKYYFRHLADKSIFRCIILLIPGLGNLVVLIYDLATRKRYAVQLQRVAEGKKSHLRRLANVSESSAMFELSLVCDNASSAAFWLGQAVARDSFSANLCYGKALCRNGKSRQGLQYITQAAESPSELAKEDRGEAHFVLFEIYGKGLYGVEKNPQQAEQHFKKALALGATRANSLLHSLERVPGPTAEKPANGAAADVEPEETLDSFALDIALENSPLTPKNLALKYKLACNIQNGKSYIIDIVKYLDLLKAIAKYKNPDLSEDLLLITLKAKFRLALCIKTRDKQESIKLFEELENQKFLKLLEKSEDSDSLFVLGKIYLSGSLKVQRNKQTAMDFFKGAVKDVSNTEAMIELYELSVSSDKVKAIEWLSKATKLENPTAACFLAKLLEDDQDTNIQMTKDDLILLLKLHADKKMAAANYFLFIVYMSMKVKTQDAEIQQKNRQFEEFAFKYLSCAVEQGYSKAKERYAKIMIEEQESNDHRLTHSQKELLSGEDLLKAYERFKIEEDPEAFSYLNMAMEKGYLPAYEACIKLFEETESARDNLPDLYFKYYQALENCETADAQERSRVLTKAASLGSKKAIALVGAKY